MARTPARLAARITPFLTAADSMPFLYSFTPSSPSARPAASTVSLLSNRPANTFAIALSFRFCQGKWRGERVRHSSGKHDEAHVDVGGAADGQAPFHAGFAQAAKDAGNLSSGAKSEPPDLQKLPVGLRAVIAERDHLESSKGPRQAVEVTTRFARRSGATVERIGPRGAPTSTRWSGGQHDQEPVAAFEGCADLIVPNLWPPPGRAGHTRRARGGDREPRRARRRALGPGRNGKRRLQQAPARATASRCVNAPRAIAICRATSAGAPAYEGKRRKIQGIPLHSPSLTGKTRSLKRCWPSA